MKKHEHEHEHENDQPLVDEVLGAMRAQEGDTGALDPLDDVSRRRHINDILDAHHSKPDSVSNSSTLRTRLLKISSVAALLTIAALSYWLVTGTPDSAPVSPIATQASFLPQSRFVLLEGTVRVSDGPVSVDTSVPTGSLIETGEGRAVVALSPGSSCSLTSNTSILANLNKGQTVNVKLSHGSALFAIDPKEHANGFTVTTANGVVKVKGTVFKVDVTSSETKVDVLEGQVEIVSKTGSGQTVDRWQSSTMGAVDSHPEPLSEAVSRSLVAMVEEITDLGLGDHHGRVIKAKESFILENEAAEVAQIDEPVEVDVGKTPRPQKPKLKDLLTAAREAKYKGDFQLAARNYDQLVRIYPKSADAKTSRIILARLFLNKLGHPNYALKNFDKYLHFHPNGALAKEALFGKAKALRAMSKTGEEKKALQQLLKRFPSGIHVSKAERRLAEISKTE